MAKKKKLRVKKIMPPTAYAKGGMVKCATGGSVRGTGCATRGKTSIKVY